MMIQSAMDWAQRNNIPPEMIADVYNHPEYSYSDPVHEHNERRMKGQWCLVVDPDGVILSVLPAASAQIPIEDVEDIKVPKAKSGGGGTAYPTSYEELLALLDERGYPIGHSGSGHINVYDRDDHSRLIYVLPSSASDYRSLRNGIAGLKKAGVDLKRSI